MGINALPWYTWGVWMMIMSPGMVWLYHRLAVKEEQEVTAAFGPRWDNFERSAPGCVPHLDRPFSPGHPEGQSTPPHRQSNRSR